MSAVDDLLNFIFENKKPFFYKEFEGWVRGSRRFKAFAQQYGSKCRTKLRSVRDEAGMKDLYTELHTAVLLLREERFTLEYEKYAAAKQRGPDFTVTFKTHTPFNVEVRRVREWETENRDLWMAKLMTVLCDKVGQMPPGVMNLLWLNAECLITNDELTQAGLLLRQMADHKMEVFFTQRGFDSAADFLKRYAQLSGIVVLTASEKNIWLNPLARHKPLAEIVLALQRLVL